MTSINAGDAAASADASALAADAQDVEQRAWVVPEASHGQRLDKELARAVPEYSRSHLQALIQLGVVRVNGLTATTASQKLRVGQQVALDLVPTAQSQSFTAQSIPLEILHEDEHLLVLNKPVGLVVHPAAGHWQGTLLNGLLAHHGAAFDLPRAGIVHRLDKDTSGLMVVAKSLMAMAGLVRAIAARDVGRSYEAVAHGRVGPESFTIDAPIGRDPVARARMAVHAHGKPSRTDVQRVACAEVDGQTFSALSCRLHTGRTHQIRVHLASRGHALVADTLYGGKLALGMHRQALHARRLAFVHPIDGQPLTFDQAPPDDFALAWNAVVSRGKDD